MEVLNMFVCDWCGSGDCKFYDEHVEEGNCNAPEGASGSIGTGGKCVCYRSKSKEIERLEIEILGVKDYSFRVTISNKLNELVDAVSKLNRKDK